MDGWVQGLEFGIFERWACGLSGKYICLELVGKVKERRLFVVKLLPSSAEWNQRLPDVYIHLK